MSGVWFHYTKIKKSCFWRVHGHVHLVDYAHANWCYP
jgi:ssRNA-specific RNase YbeY (16S rRNA maturation enzyme)